MASGTFERPLPDPASERSLLGLGGFSGVMRAEMPAGATRYLVFEQQNKGGLLVTWSNGAEAAGKSGLYHLSSSSSNTITLPAVKAVTRTGVTITPLNNQVIEIVNPSGSGYMWLAVIMFYGNRPTMQTTNPSA